MAFDSIVNGLVSGITGNTNRGYILMHRPDKDPAAEEMKTKTKEEIAAERNAVTGGLSELASTLQNPAAAAGGAVSNALKSAGNSALSAMGKDSALTTAANEKDYIPVKIQFNPSSISFSGRGGRIRRESVGGFGENQFQQFDSPVETVLGMQLILDDTNNKDAFMMDAELPLLSEITSVGGLVQRMEQGVSALRGKEYSVQDATELFVAAMTQYYTRMVGFAWNKMIFWGELVGVSVQYTMFNKTGAPIRATVDLEIRQDKAVTGQKAYATEEQWETTFNNLFKENDGNNAFGIKNSKATNWLNGNFLNLG